MAEEKKIEFTMYPSTSEYNPAYIIERNGEAIIKIYEDACDSPAQSQMIAQTILLKLQNIFHDNR